MADVLSHAHLVERARRWLRRVQGCPVVLTELNTVEEVPDAIGWCLGASILVECKVTRADFLADRDKAFRRDPAKGMGTWRYFLAPPGLIRVEELPEGWGLLEAHAGTIRRVRPSHGARCGCNGRSPRAVSCAPAFPANHRTEIQMLLSLARRLAGDGITGAAVASIDPYRIRMPTTGTGGGLVLDEDDPPQALSLPQIGLGL